MTQRVHIHIGPHKTGSTAVQHHLSACQAQLSRDHGLTVFMGKPVNDIARDLIAEDTDAARAKAAKLRGRIEAAGGDCLVSCEDFSGDLPGRSGKKKIYPRLWQNLDFLRTALRGLDVRFYFFERTPTTWLRSAYIQHLKHRTRFSRFEAFESHFQTEALWGDTLSKARAKLGDDLVVIPYEEASGFSSARSLLGAVLGPSTSIDLPRELGRTNSAPSPEIITILEAINASSASQTAKKSAKTSILETAGSEPNGQADAFPVWPPSVPEPAWLPRALSALWTRAGLRVARQDQPYLLPAPGADLVPFRTKPVVGPADFPEGGRGKMQNQINILSYRFAGLPETCLLLGLSISYLRRDTPHTAEAAQLFQRLWAEESDILLGVLPTRWLISAFQTFMDHGANEAQRLAGAAAYFMSNTLKAYEAERALEGLAPDAIYPSVRPSTKRGFKGLDRFALGGTDLMLNTNALLLELAARDAVSGRVIAEFMLRLKDSHSVFSRMDQSRLAHDINNPQFANCWSFFDPPKGGNRSG